MDLEDFQSKVAEKFKDFDLKSGPFFLMTVLMAEVGELADGIKRDDRENIAEELSDLVFTALSIANIYNIDLSGILEEKYIERGKREISKNWKEPSIEGRQNELDD